MTGFSLKRKFRELVEEMATLPGMGALISEITVS